MAVMFPKTYNIKISVKGRYIDGKFVKGTPTESTIIGDIQPLNSYEMVRMDIGDRGIGKVKIYTDETLNVSGKTKDVPGDYVQFEGNWYEVLYQDTHVGIMSHKKYFAEFRKNELV